ncbi:acyl-CoA dehydrogenase family protein [Nitrospina sp. 32_T5]|uniref:acyl-CoA dehydrogenase family protein n=1 Tax=unclassified Nitrospina TaxID=2638683 RepID=UPI003F9B3DFB
MSYAVSAQKDLLTMMYGDETHLEMLDAFGKLVEERVLPAEMATEVARAANPLQEFRSQLLAQDTLDKNAVEAVYEKARSKRKVPDNVFQQIMESGLTAMPFAEELGGLDLPFPLFIAFLETLGKASPSIGVRYAISNTVAEGLKFNYHAGRLSDYGRSMLEALVSGEHLAAFCLTEASASGSNIMQEMATRAVLNGDGGEYSLTGNKFWITNAESATVFGVFARTSKDPRHGVSLFLVERAQEGCRTGQVFEKYVVENSSFGEIVFNEVKLPLDHMVGQEGFGMDYAMRMLNSGRITIAALATGLAQRAFEEYLEVAIEGKKTAGRHLIEYDRTKAKVAELSTEIDAARGMTYRAAWMKDQYDKNSSDGDLLSRYVVAANSAKLKAAAVAQKACNYLIQIWGASSVVKENRAMKHYLDSWLYYFGEAVPEVLENTLSRMEVKRYKARKGLQD